MEFFCYYNLVIQYRPKMVMPKEDTLSRLFVCSCTVEKAWVPIVPLSTNKLGPETHRYNLVKDI